MLSATEYDQIMDHLSYVEDPELGVNIVDLGLIYDLKREDNTLLIDMTLTYAGCPLTDFLTDEIHDALYSFNLDIKINWVWIPTWSLARVTDEGRDQLRALGMSIDAVHENLGA